jgi:hypothetical protein
MLDPAAVNARLRVRSVAKTQQKGASAGQAFLTAGLGYRNIVLSHCLCSSNQCGININPFYGLRG